jgi:hypothetical protein
LNYTFGSSSSLSLTYDTTNNYTANYYANQNLGNDSVFANLRARYDEPKGDSNVSESMNYWNSYGIFAFSQTLDYDKADKADVAILLEIHRLCVIVERALLRKVGVI